MTEITLLMDNTGSDHYELATEHGLSVLIEDNGYSLLFDAGSSDCFIANALLLQKNLQHIDTAVISHNHYDHTGGFMAFVRQWKHPVRRVIVGRDFFLPRYESVSYSYTYLGASFTKKNIEDSGVEVATCLSTLRLSDCCFVVSGYTRTNDIEHPVPNFLMRDHNTFRIDDFSDECSIVIEAKDGLHLVVGCSHFGILNIVRHVASTFAKPVVAVYGGVHFMDSEQEYIINILQGLKKENVVRFGLCHCSGAEVHEILARDFSELEAARLSVGSTIFID